MNNIKRNDKKEKNSKRMGNVIRRFCESTLGRK